MVGGAGEELARKAVDWWMEAATRGGSDLMGFDPGATLEKRLSWAKGLGLEIGGSYTRFSTRMQHSTETQVMTCVTYAGLNSIYIPPEMLCIDENVKGRRSRRKGFARLQAILEGKHIDTLLVFKASRIYRKAHKSMGFIDEEVVERGIRAVSVCQGIDTNNEQAWRPLFGNVTRAWVTQIMDLLLLAPNIQEEVLFLTAESERKQPVSMRRIRNIVAEPEWKEQRRLWSSLLQSVIPDAMRASVLSLVRAAARRNEGD